MSVVEMDFEKILKTHYFLFTSSSSLCAAKFKLEKRFSPMVKASSLDLNPRFERK